MNISNQTGDEDASSVSCISSMSLLSLKTRDLTWQDHTLNIEVMLAPSRSTLLWNKHKSLTSHCSKDKKKFERQFENVVKNYKSEKILIDRRRVDLYTKRTLVFLEKLTPELRNEMLSRKSFSISLNRIATEISEVDSGRLSAPAVPNRTRQIRQESSTSSAKSEPSPRRHSSLPLLDEQRRKLSTTGLSDKTTDSARKSGTQLFSVKHGSPRQDVLISNSTNSPRNYISTVEERLPNISYDQTMEVDTYSTERLRPASGFRETSIDGYIEGKPQRKVVRFENIPKEKVPSKLQEKIKGFLKEQNRFNANTPISGRSDLARKVAQKETVDSANLVNAFDKFCQLKNKKKLQNLVKLATKLKVATTPSHKELPSIEVITPSGFSVPRQSISVS